MSNDFYKMVIDKHKDQKRKNSINGFSLPYFFHEFQVAKLVFSLGFANNDINLAASGHDLLEDTDCKEEEILSLSNQNVLSIIKELTFDPKSYLSKDEYLASFENKSVESLIIKICDRLCNVSDFCISEPNNNYYKKYFNKAFKLMEMFELRENEIVLKFGIEPFLRLKSLINRYYSNINSMDLILL